MTRMWKHLAVIVALVLGGAVWACEQPTGPTHEVEQLEADGQSELLGSLTTQLLGDLAGLFSVTTDLVTEASHLTKIIGVDGGVLELGGHVLTVPSGSVLQPTFFTLLAVPNGYVEVHLRAIQPEVGNIGSRGFETPVRLALSYAGADIDDPEDLVIVRVQTEERLDTELDEENSLVLADLDHFSRYRLCTN